MSDGPKLLEMPNKDKESVERVLKEMLECSEYFSGVVVIGLNKDGSQFLKTSTMNDMERATAFGIHQAYIVDVFRTEKS